MGFLDWLLGTHRPPSWASALGTKERFERFVEEVERALRARGHRFDADLIRTGSVVIEGPRPRERTELTLHEAARRCAEADEGAWERIVREDLSDDATEKEPSRRAKRAKKREGPRAPSPHTLTIGDRTIDLANGPLDHVAPLLKAQLFSSRSRGVLGVLDRTALVTRELAGDIVIVVMIDLGGASQTLHAEEAGRWGAGHDLIELAIANAVADCPIQITSLDLGAPAEMWVGNGHFVGALALRPDAIGRAVPERGALVAIPNWHCVLWHAVEERTLDALPALADLAARTFDYADPVSPDLFWVRGGRWVKIDPAQPPEELVALAK